LQGCVGLFLGDVAAATGALQAARVVNPVSAGIADLALNWSIMIDPSPVVGSACCGSH
jgi:hypothetical protein